MSLRLFTSSLGCLILLSVQPAAAQSQGSAETSPDASSTPVQAVTTACMRGSAAKRDASGSKTDDQAYALIVPARDAAGFKKKGFVEVPCENSSLKDAKAKADWRDEVCELAAFGNEAVQNQLERALGERPAVLCGTAEQVAGEWDRKVKRVKVEAVELEQ